MKKSILLMSSLFALCALTTTSCGKTEKEEDNKVKTYPHTLVNNGESDYEFIYPSVGATTESAGASLLASYIHQSTGVNIPVKKDIERNTNKKFISFGKTNEYINSNLNLDKSKMNYDGYGIKTIGDNMFVIGGDSNVSYSYSALYLLEDFINFRGFHDTEIDFDYVNKIGFDDYELYDAPTFRNRDMHNGDLRISDDVGTYSLLLRNNPEVFSKYGNAHTCFKVVDPTAKPCVDVMSAIDVDVNNQVSFKYQGNTVSGKVSSKEIAGDNVKLTIGGQTYIVDKNFKIKRTFAETSYISVHPDWFTGTSKSSQWCWSNDDLFETAAMKVEEYMETLMTSSVNYIFISQNDLQDWCSCEKCNQSRDKYGTDAAVVVKFINKMADRVKAKQIELGIEDQFLRVGTFAYEVTTTQPPVKTDENGNYVPIDEEVILRDNAFIRIAPINTDYSKPMSSSSNVPIAEAFKGWSVLTNNIVK